MGIYERAKKVLATSYYHISGFIRDTDLYESRFCCCAIHLYTILELTSSNSKTMDRKLSRKFLLFSIILFVGAGILLLLARIVDQPLILLFLSKVGLLIGGGGTGAIWGLRIFFGEDRADALLINLIILGITFIILISDR